MAPVTTGGNRALAIAAALVVAAIATAPHPARADRITASARATGGYDGAIQVGDGSEIGSAYGDLQLGLGTLWSPSRTVDFYVDGVGGHIEIIDATDLSRSWVGARAGAMLWAGRRLLLHGYAAADWRWFDDSTRNGEAIAGGLAARLRTVDVLAIRAAYRAGHTSADDPLLETNSHELWGSLDWLPRRWVDVEAGYGHEWVERAVDATMSGVTAIDYVWEDAHLAAVDLRLWPGRHLAIQLGYRARLETTDGATTEHAASLSISVWR